jgi:RNA polymerase sigma factor (TIGR02999 family)
VIPDPPNPRNIQLEVLVPEIYAELRRLAGQAMRHQPPGHTLQPTALVHEAYLKLAAAHHLALADRGHLLATAATAMRQVLVDHARSQKRDKRGGQPLRVTLPEGAARAEPAIDLLALDEALSRLGAIDGQQVRIIELRYLAGLTVEEAAELLGLSPRTIKRETATAKAWLMREIERGPADS